MVPHNFAKLHNCFWVVFFYLKEKKDFLVSKALTSQIFSLYCSRTYLFIGVICPNGLGFILPCDTPFPSQWKKTKTQEEPENNSVLLNSFEIAPVCVNPCYFETLFGGGGEISIQTKWWKNSTHHSLEERNNATISIYWYYLLQNLSKSEKLLRLSYQRCSYECNLYHTEFLHLAAV